MAFHAAPAQIRSGFVGVDIFFVISGFLITRIIASSPRERGWIPAFYGRRIRRLFPALILVLVSATAGAALLLPERDFSAFLRHLLASALFVPNFAFMQEAGYFELPAGKPLLHLWSLGVEEQFYLVWPATIALLLRSRRGMVGIACIAGASFLANLLYLEASSAGSFYSPLSRAWQFASGAVLALGPVRVDAVRPAAHHVSSLAGLTLILASLIVIPPGLAYPGWWGLLPTAGATLMIAAGPSGWANRHLLSHPLAVAIGLISYPLYLWHWPFISFASAITLDELPWTWRLGAVLLSFPAAWLTYRFLERPARQGGSRTAYALLAGMAAIAVAAAAWAQAPGLFRPELDPRRQFVSHYRNLPKELARRHEDCSLGRRWSWRRSALPAQCVSTGPNGSWMLWGDSHAAALSPGLRANMPAGVGLTLLTGSGCPPLAETKSLCAATTRYGLDLVRRLRPEVLLLVQQGEHDSRDWPAISRQLREAGAGVVIVVGPVPQWRRSLPQIAATRYWPAMPVFEGREIDREILATDARLRTESEANRPEHYLSLVAELCSREGCRTLVPAGRSSELILMDYGHLTPTGASYVARRIIVPEVQAIIGAHGSPGATQPPPETRD